MQISITARQCEISAGVRQFAQQRLEKLTKYANDIHGIHVIVRHERMLHEVEITVSVNGTELVSTQQHAEAGAALELAADRLEEQLRRLKDRRIDRVQRTPAERAAAGLADTETAGDLAAEGE